jgi:hypothetical protein
LAADAETAKIAATTAPMPSNRCSLLMECLPFELRMTTRTSRRWPQRLDRTQQPDGDVGGGGVPAEGF